MSLLIGQHIKDRLQHRSHDPEAFALELSIHVGLRSFEAKAARSA